MEKTLARPLTGEFIGTGLLVAAVVGSGIMAERLSAGNVAVALLANTIATGAALFVLIVMFAAVSRAHFNPAVTFAAMIYGELKAREAASMAAVQIAGALLGAGLANVMFELPVYFESTKVRFGAAQLLSEFVATFGLVGTIVCCTRRQRSVTVVAASVAAWIMAAYWFTSSTSFANPAVTIGRMFSDTFTGIRPIDAPAFIIAQFAGGISAAFVFRWLVPEDEQ